MTEFKVAVKPENTTDVDVCDACMSEGKLGSVTDGCRTMFMCEECIRSYMDITEVCTSTLGGKK